MKTSELATWTLLFCLGSPLGALPSIPRQDDEDDEEPTPCEMTAEALRMASMREAQDDYWIGIANCTNLARRSEAIACFRDNTAALGEALARVAEQLEARLDLCDALGGERYDPRIDARDFVAGVTHPLFPLVPGRTKVFEKETDEGLERIEVTTTHDVKSILGVTCTVVQDTVSLDGVLIEDTLDYFAQDRGGNVWYFGELAMNFEDGELRDLSGSWIAGVDGAKPGIVMKAAPAVGNVYRQEFLVNEAEDAARVVGLGRRVMVPVGTFTGCLETLDFTPLEPGHLESKFYAPGVGFVLQVTVETGEREELVAIF